ncbi:aminotransferase class IV family protein [Shinella sp. CPCC 101442]|uniref:aminotransferase class IV family protein n=1 Tax=Shinella sp. CPCC 101442 TaxID=2932265 RepID=UPI0021523476|nr:aminotransferase class IV family protein [Shinella sp. CPCC 101442]MCR6501201.1 aminotransferase class IV family protein [Shinella sp. CPCC 101442]
MDFSLIETLRWEPGIGFVRLERHLARLTHSAALCGLTGAEKAEDALRAALPDSNTPLRIRLELFPDGRIEVQAAAFTPLAADAIWRLKIAETRLASTDPLLRHKTSRRAPYVAARAEFPAGEADEVILLNERGELCEGTITSLFLDDGAGILKTPPLAAGLLAGVLRADLLENGKAVEAVLRPEDLSGGKIFIGNSLRGLIRGTLS